MKRFVVFALTMVLTINAVWGQSEMFRILYLNTATVNIGGKELSRGDCFNDSDVIRWSSADQAMRVVSVGNGRQYVVTSRNAGKEKSSLMSYLISDRSLSTRPGKPNTIIGLRNAIADTLLILDRCEFETSLPVDSERFFYATYSHKGESINKILPALESGGFAIDRSLWTIDGRKQEPKKTIISIYYYNEAEGIVTAVAEDVVVIPLNSDID